MAGPAPTARPAQESLQDCALAASLASSPCTLEFGRQRPDSRKDAAQKLPDPTATGNQGRTVEFPLTCGHRADQGHRENTTRRPGSRFLSIVDEAGVRRSKPQSQLSVFYGFPAELIAAWCGVSVATAAQWKAGVRKPSRQALRLFSLFSQEQVIPKEFRGFRFRRGKLVDPAGCELSPGQIQGYVMVMQYAADLARRAENPADRERFFALLKRVG